VKLSIGTAVVTQNLQRKLDVYKSNGIPVYFGGTLFEAFASQNQADNYKKLLDACGLEHVEISNGMNILSEQERLDYIEKFKHDFIVFSEVGSKDDDLVIPPFKWVEMIKATIDAGALYVITEGRQHGNAGIYQKSGDVRKGLLEEINAHVSIDNIIFEAPQAEQQIYLINNFGPNVNIANVSPKEIVVLETQRIGLRYETYNTMNQMFK